MNSEVGVDFEGSESLGFKWVVVKIRGPVLGTLNNRCRIILRTQKGTLILTTTQVAQVDFCAD